MVKRLVLSGVLVMVLLLLGACHEGDGVFHWLTPEAPRAVIEPSVLPADEVGLDEPEPMPEPPCAVVKGNISRDGRKLYHLEGMPNFNQVKIDEEAGERFFCSVEEAEAAGWARAGG